MAKFPSLTFTEAGMKMLIMSQNGHTLTFTKGKLGSGVLTDSDDITKFTDLKAPKMELPVVKKDDSGKEKISLTFNTSNTALEEGFVSRELGVFAKLDNGAETLYAYSNAGNDYDYIPNKDTPTDENRLVVNLIVSSSANINVLVDGSIVYAHMSDLDERLQVTTTAGKPASMDEKGLWVEIKSGLKAILHRWNKTTKTYDTLHPETETSQITDFDTAVNGKINAHNTSGAAHSTLFNRCEKTSSLANDIVTKLAQTTAISVISALQTNSWFGQLLKLVLNASGMKYLIAQNGYICFGSLFGGLILQWGTWMESDSAKSMTVKLPISARIYQVFLTDSSLEGNSAFNFTMCWDRDHAGTNVSLFNVKSTDPPSSFSWFFVGREN